MTRQPLKSILFVCNGNAFRSPSAAFAFKEFLTTKGITGWKVSSAGLRPDKKLDATVKAYFQGKGVSTKGFVPQKVTPALLRQFDIVVAMAQEQYDYIKNKLNCEPVFLFNELARKQRTSIVDVRDCIKDYRHNSAAVELYIQKTVTQIRAGTPTLFQNAIERFYLFVDFVGGQKVHRNGYPFIALQESRNALAFMSIDIPSKEDGHIIVIPKKRYSDFAEIPSSILQEQLNILRKIGTTIGKHHGGYNIFLNNGRDAGQYIFHSHFHIVPRRFNDNIRVEVWKNRLVSRTEFVKLNRLLIQQIRSLR